MITNDKKGAVGSARLKYLLIISMFMAFLCISAHAFAQTAPASPPAGPPGGPPPPPPPPDELFKKIFKKHKKDSTSTKSDGTNNKTAAPPSGPSAQPSGPPPPPNPLNLFRKKKKDTTKTGKG